MESLLSLLHGADYIFNHLLIGSIIFYYLIMQAGGDDAEKIDTKWQIDILSLLSLSFATSFLWMILSVHSMADTWEIKDLWTGVTETSFAHLWCLKLIIFIVGFLILKYSKQRQVHFITLMFLAIAVSITYTLTGHASSQEDYYFIRVFLDFAHSFGAGVWTGGLWSLYIWLGHRLNCSTLTNPRVSYNIITRFSHFAMVSTGLIALSGIGTSWLNHVSFVKPWETNYGLLVVVKTVFFTCALGAAAINQFLHLRTWNDANEIKFCRAVRREVLIELALVFAVFTVAGFLTRISLSGT